MAQSASMGGLASAETDRSSLARFRTVEVLLIDREWRNLMDGSKEGREDNGWRGAQWNGVVGGRRATPRIDPRMGRVCG